MRLLVMVIVDPDVDCFRLLKVVVIVDEQSENDKLLLEININPFSIRVFSSGVTLLYGAASRSVTLLNEIPFYLKKYLVIQ